MKIDTLPGLRFRYSNVGANLTAYILENVYEISYEQLLQKYIFNLSKMKNTKLSLDNKEQLSLIQGYNTKKIKMPFFSQSMRAAGALKSTLPDMMKYISLQLKETNRAVKLSHESIWASANSSFSMGYFWQIDSNNGNKKIFQNGGSFGTSSWIEFYPETKIGFFLMTNVSGPDIHNQLSKLTQLIHEEIAAK